jgi:prevent-host-death family protein
MSILATMSKMEIMDMEPTRVTASQFQQAFGMLSDKARREPVVITKHGRASLVVMAAEEWARLKRGDQQAGQTTQLREESAEAARSAMAPQERAPRDAEAARHGAPTIVAQDSGPAAAIAPIEDGRRIDVDDRPSFAELLLSAPHDIEADRDRTLAREINL